MKITYLANIRLPTEKAHGAQIMKTCEALAKAGVEVELVVTNRKSEAADPFIYYGVESTFKIIRLPVLDTVTWGPLGFLLEAASFGVAFLFYALSHRPDVVYSRDELPLFLVNLFFGHCVWESHTGAYNFFAKRFLAKHKKTVVISQGLKDFYLSKGAAADMLVAHDAIDLNAFINPESQAAARIRLGLPPDKKVAMYIGRLDGWKGVKTLLDAAALLPPGLLVAIIGGEETQVSELSKKYPSVSFLGSRPYRELADNEAAADILVLPNTAQDVVSARFTSPMKLFSYMAAGRPIVASDLPSIREVLTENSAKFFIPDDPKSLAEAIVSVFESVEVYKLLAQTAQAEVINYSWQKRAEAIIGFI
jgi:glycosyltransferase involved in cell wall biosynthesis